jgi:hypothetical protein
VTSRLLEELDALDLKIREILTDLPEPVYGLLRQPLNVMLAACRDARRHAEEELRPETSE